MSRINRHVMALEIAQVAAKRATCFRRSVGAVVVFDGRVISIGYNGPPAGDEHCKGPACELTSSGGCARSIHAEQNAIDFLEKTMPPERLRRLAPDMSLYSTTCPCPSCALEIHGVGIGMTYFQHEYRNMLPALNILAGKILRLTSSGHVVHPVTGVIGPYID